MQRLLDPVKADRGIIGEEKAKTNSSVNVPGRENEILARVTKETPEELKIYVKQL